MINATAKPFVIVAHRGVQTDQNPEKMAPENTLPALTLGAQAGVADEFDVWPDANGHLVVYHDDRTGHIFVLPGAQKEIRKATWAELQQATLNVGAYEKKVVAIQNGKPYTIPAELLKERIPDLQQVLQAVPDSPLFVELKHSKKLPGDKDFEKNVLKTLEENHALDRVTFLSFNPRSLAKLKALNPNVKTMLDIYWPSYLKPLENNRLFLKMFIMFAAYVWPKVDGINPCYAKTSQALVDICHQNNLKVMPYVYGENRAQEVQAFPRLQRLGVDGVITNAVDLAKDFFQKSTQPAA
jgi:glycerophosphoryl diester phosphodiesterase